MRILPMLAVFLLPSGNAFAQSDSRQPGNSTSYSGPQYQQYQQGVPYPTGVPIGNPYATFNNNSVNNDYQYGGASPYYSNHMSDVEKIYWERQWKKHQKRQQLAPAAGAIAALDEEVRRLTVGVQGQRRFLHELMQNARGRGRRFSNENIYEDGWWLVNQMVGLLNAFKRLSLAIEAKVKEHKNHEDLLVEPAKYLACDAGYLESKAQAFPRNADKAKYHLINAGFAHMAQDIVNRAEQMHHEAEVLTKAAQLLHQRVAGYSAACPRIPNPVPRP